MGRESRIVYVDGQPFQLGPGFVHPGGDKILERAWGMDVTDQFRGTSGGHAHSPAAHQLLWEHHRPDLATCPDGAGMGQECRRVASSREPVDCAAPILAQVRSLSAATYHTWVHAPVRGQPRFFASDALENLTKIQWWMVPLLWVPMACAWLATAARTSGLPSAACYAVAGALSWQAVEYTLHRWVFHARPRSAVAICTHFLLHGCHHKFPLDVDRLVFPPLPAALIAACLYSVIKLVLPAAGLDASFGGLLLGYVRYDCMHYLMHCGRLGGRLRAAHMHHHYSNHEEAFGISGGWLDWALGTRAAIGAARRSMAKTWPRRS